MTDFANLPSLVQRIRELAEELPDAPVYTHVAVDGSTEVLTWSWLNRRSGQLAVELARRGVGRGDRVALGLRNSPHFVLSVLAAWKVGAVPIPMRWDLPDWEVLRLVQVIQPAVQIMEADRDWIERTDDGHDATDLPEVVSPHVQGICSSGSTGTPKIILSSVPAVCAPFFSTPIAERWGPVPRPQTTLVLAPMYHVNAFVALHCMIAGDRLVVMEGFDATAAIDLIEAERITTFTATPTMLQRMADVPGVDDRDLSSLVWLLQGAAPMPASLVHRWAALIGAERIVMAYGMTESLGLTVLRGDEWMQHPGSVGLPSPGTSVQILDDAGQELPTGEIGEIYLRTEGAGDTTYVGDVPQLRRTEQGYATVGDLGYVDDDGYVYLVDRRVDMIVSGGANVFPAEVEAALIDHPRIADVVVIGLLDPEWGRRVHAVVEPSDQAAPPSEAEVIAYAKSRLAAYKVPKTVELVERIPRSAATKVNRGTLVAARGG